MQRQSYAPRYQHRPAAPFVNRSSVSDYPVLPEPKRFFILNAEHRAQVLAPLSLRTLINYIDKLEIYRNQHRDRIEYFTKMYSPILQSRKISPEMLSPNQHNLATQGDEVLDKDEAKEMTKKAQALQEKILNYDKNKIAATISKIENFLEGRNLQKFISSQSTQQLMATMAADQSGETKTEEHRFVEDSAYEALEPKPTSFYLNMAKELEQLQHPFTKNIEVEKEADEKTSGKEEAKSLNALVGEVGGSIALAPSNPWSGTLSDRNRMDRWRDGEKHVGRTGMPQQLPQFVINKMINDQTSSMSAHKFLSSPLNVERNDEMVAKVETEFDAKEEAKFSFPPPPSIVEDAALPEDDVLPSSIRLAAMAKLTNMAASITLPADTKLRNNSNHQSLPGDNVQSTEESCEEINIFIAGRLLPLPKVFNALSDHEKIQLTRNLPEVARGRYLNLCWESILFDHLSKMAAVRLDEH